jgi:hypothetical protein
VKRYTIKQVSPNHYMVIGINALLTKEEAEYIAEACNNYNPLQTNYNNLLQEHEEVCAVNQANAKEAEEFRQLSRELLGALSLISTVFALNIRNYKRFISYTDSVKLIAKAKELLGDAE